MRTLPRAGPPPLVQRPALAAQRDPDRAALDRGAAGRGAADLGALHADLRGGRAARAGALHPAAAGRARAGRRLRQRHRRHAGDGGDRLADLGAARHHRRGLPRRDRPRQPARRRDPLHRQGADRLSVDPRRCVRLCLAGAGDGHLFGARRRRRAGGADAADGDADRRAGGAHGAAADEGRGLRHGLHPHPDDPGRWCCRPRCPAS